MKLHQFLPLAALISGSFGAQAALVDLTTLGYYTYGNVNSYSMPLSGISIPSSPGNIKETVVIYTGAGGQDITTNVAGFNDAFQVPSGNVAGYTSMGENLSIVQPGTKTGINNDAATTWDANLLSLKSYLAGGTALFLFNNNETNKDQTLSIWADFWITGATNNLYNHHLYLSNLDQAYGAGGLDGSPSGPTHATTYYADHTNTQTGGPSTGYSSTDFVASGGNVGGENHNLGADHVAYAGNVPLLNTWLSTLFAMSDDDLTQYTFHLDLRMGCISKADWGGSCDNVQIDNGYEQLFLVSNDNPSLTPEPTSLALIGSALAALGLVRRRRNRKSN